MGKSQKLYKKAKKIIPGGTQLLSKRPEMFCQICGRHIMKKQRVVKFGILMESIIMTWVLWA